MRPEQIPIIVGVGQTVNRSGEVADARDPLTMMAATARAAAEDAAAPRLLAELDTVLVINLLSWSYPDAPGQLAAALGAHPRRALYSGIGGNTPQWAVNEFADRIRRGEAQAVLIAGAEAMNSLRQARRRGVKLPWPERPAAPPPTMEELKWGNTPLEQAHRAQMPTQIYPLFENALRAERHWSLAEHRAYLGRLCERFSATAAGNPYAWFREPRTAAEIATPSAENRLIGFPYPKFMNAIMDVDQSAALLLTNVATACRLGVPAERWVYVRGSGDALDHWYVSDRVNYHSSPAIRAAGHAALTQAGLDISQVDVFDLYSCFPCAPQIAAAMLGIAADDPRPLTVTGGLPYAGGPGNNYSTHAIAAMVSRLRAHPGRVGMVTGVGWYLTKHAVGIYSATPPDGVRTRVPLREYQMTIDAMEHPTCVTEAEGEGHVETYTVLHDRDGTPETGVIVGRLGNGNRFWANTPADRALLDVMEQREMIGCRGRVRHEPSAGVNRFEPDVAS